MHKKLFIRGFTIVELLVVIVVIGILAVLVIGGYSAMSQRAVTSSLQADLNGGKKLVEAFYATNGVYPTANNCTNTLTTEVCLKPSSGNTFTYTPSSTSSPSGYALSVLNSSTKQTAATSTSDPYFANVVALLKGDGSNGSTTITDSSPLVSNWTANGGASISTAQAKYGGSSIFLSNPNVSTGGSGSSRVVATILEMGSSDFTIESWMYPTTMGTSYFRAIAITSPSNSQYSASNYTFGFYANGSLFFYTNLMASQSTAGSIVANQWTHVAVSRQGLVLRLFINGQLVATNNSINNSFTATSVAIGGYPGMTSTLDAYDGYIDDLRITKGVARYTSNFTPPGAL